MSIAVTSRSVDPSATPIETTAVATPSAPSGVGAEPSTIESAAPAESNGCCAQIGAFFSGIGSSISNFFSSIFAKMMGLFGKGEAASAEETPLTTPVDQTAGRPQPASLDVLRAMRDVVVSGADLNTFRQVFQTIPDEADRSAIRGRMWQLAAPNPASPQQLHDRRPASHWSNRIIMGEVQTASEIQPLADIQHHVDILAPGSLFRRALDAVIAEREAAIPAT